MAPSLHDFYRSQRTSSSGKNRSTNSGEMESRSSKWINIKSRKQAFQKTTASFLVPSHGLFLGDCIPILTRLSKHIQSDRVPPTARNTFTLATQKETRCSPLTGFLSLPAEIRNQIYDLYTESLEDVHIAFFQTRLVSTRCNRPELRAEHCARAHDWARCYRVSCLKALEGTENRSQARPVSGIGLLPLIRTCRQV